MHERARAEFDYNKSGIGDQGLIDELEGLLSEQRVGRFVFLEKPNATFVNLI